ncbi:hypothetical protein [Limnoglobus roseus]|uniref:SMI1/KNR4 family protein n=1 Tax=Limnoglobus roseus TaxID=2598579 RepID=A0A5C1AH58_9BACT|nr:hypothetical protein [Limnoglobus roseus]QEL17583.1 SMI1/KNR4 family protein [Limnoglobus roseus]
MTEAEWLAVAEPRKMLEYLIGRVSVRKQRLFACACCRRIWHLLADPRSRHAVETAERFVDGDVTTGEIEAAMTAADDAADDAHGPGSEAAEAAADVIADVRGCAIAAASAGDQQRRVERFAQSVLLRDIFGNAFRPVTFSPDWLTPTAVDLAEVIYEDRAFDRLPILADALQDAGCEDADVLGHCRSDGPHVRGCWVVDGVLGKG